MKTRKRYIHPTSRPTYARLIQQALSLQPMDGPFGLVKSEFLAFPDALEALWLLVRARRDYEAIDETAPEHRAAVYAERLAIYSVIALGQHFMDAAGATQGFSSTDAIQAYQAIGLNYSLGGMAIFTEAQGGDYQPRPRGDDARPNLLSVKPDVHI